MISDGAKILFISQYAGFIGGLEIYVASLSKLLRANGYKTYSLYVEKAKNCEAFLSSFDGSFDISEIEKISESNFDFTTLHKISDPDTLEKILDRFAPTAFVHDHDYFCPKGYKYYPYKRLNCTRPFNRLFCGVCASIVPPRHFTNGMAAMLQKNFEKSARLYSLVKRCPRFAVLSEFMASELRTNGIGAEKISVIHPWETPNKSPVRTTSNEVKRLVFAGQHVMSKGLPLMLEAVAQTKSKLILDVLGTGGRTEYFKKMASDMGLDGKVAFRGWVDNPREYFARADIALFPSLWQEPFGLSGIEAMNEGVPVVGFDVGGVSEWLKDGLNGFLVPERDTRALAFAIDKIASDDSLRIKLAENAKKFVEENYSPQVFLDNFKHLK